MDKSFCAWKLRSSQRTTITTLYQTSRPDQSSRSLSMTSTPNILAYSVISWTDLVVPGAARCGWRNFVCANVSGSCLVWLHNVHCSIQTFKFPNSLAFLAKNQTTTLQSISKVYFSKNLFGTRFIHTLPPTTNAGILFFHKCHHKFIYGSVNVLQLKAKFGQVYVFAGEVLERQRVAALFCNL